MGYIIRILFNAALLLAFVFPGILSAVNNFGFSPLLLTEATSSALSTFLSVVGNSLRNVRGAINYFISSVFGAPAITAFNVLIWVSTVGLFVFYSVKIFVFTRRIAHV